MLQVLREIEAILGRKLSPLERAKVRSKVRAGMVNPYDVIAACKLLSGHRQVAAPPANREDTYTRMNRTIAGH